MLGKSVTGDSSPVNKRIIKDRKERLVFIIAVCCTRSMGDLKIELAMEKFRNHFQS